MRKEPEELIIKDFAGYLPNNPQDCYNHGKKKERLKN